MISTFFPSENFIPRSNRWIYFLIFLVSNTLLAYAPISMGVKIGIGILGLLLPFLFLCFFSSQQPSKNNHPYSLELFNSIPKLAWIFLLAFAFFLRFYNLTTLSGWPVTDEGWHGFFGLHLMKHWDTSLLYGISRMPLGYFWALAAVFKLFGVSFFSLWLLPAFLSALALIFLLMASKKSFGRSFGFLFSSLVALSFWPLYCGRLSQPGMMAFFWESVCLWILYGFLTPPKKQGKLGWAAGLGFCVGAGFYTFTSWWSVFLLLTVFVWVHRGPDKKNNLKETFGFLIALLLTAGPFWLNLIRESYGGYVSNLFLFQSMSSFEYGWRFALSNMTMLFWGAGPSGECYRPVFGGLLNPLLASAFFIGLAWIIRNWKEAWSRWLTFALGLGLLPGIMTTSVEMYRVLPVLPFLLIVCCLGLSWLFSEINPQQSFGWFVFFLFLSTAIDTYHLLGPYHQIWGTPNSECADFKSVERWRALKELQLQSKQQGPGIIFMDFVLKSFDQTLTIADYSFDALRNSDLSIDQAKWFAVLTNPNFVPFLQKRFPGSRWYWLSQDLSRLDGGLSLGIIMIAPENKKIVEKWIAANLVFRKLTLEMIFQSQKRSGESIIQELNGFEPLVQDDVFLESCLWGKMEFYNVVMGDIDAAIHSVQKGLVLGYPNAFFYDQMGLLLSKKNDLKGARFFFQKALKCQINLTPAAQNLKELGFP